VQILSVDGQDPPTNPSENSAPEFKGEFQPFDIRSVSTTIGISRLIFQISNENDLVGLAEIKTVSSGDGSLQWNSVYAR
jgi:hypothetical protein